MKITKYKHCCLLIEEKDVKILLDPGVYSTVPNDLKADALLITHEHPDHLHVESINNILRGNKGIKIFTNKSVAKILQENKIEAEVVKNKQTLHVKNVEVEVVGEYHAQFYPTIPAIRNVGFMIAKKFYYAGDAFTPPPRKVEILAFPVVGLFMKLSESIEYVLKQKPKIVIPVHEGVLKSPTSDVAFQLPKPIIEKTGIKYVVLNEGENSTL